MSGFFADNLKSSANDMAIIKGVLAEQEETAPDKIDLVIEDNSSAANSSPDSIEDFFG